MLRSHLHSTTFCRAALLVMLLAVSARGDDDPSAGLAVPIAGQPFTARLVQIESDWTVTLDQQGQRRQVKADELVRWGSYRDAASGCQVLLRDGSVLLADVADVQQGALTTVESFLWYATTLARDSLAGVMFAPPARTIARDRLLDRIAAHRRPKDLVLLRNADEIHGLLATLPGEAESGSEFGIRSFGLSLRADRAPVEVAVENTVALLLHPNRDAPPAGARRGFIWLGFRDGTLLAVNDLSQQADAIRLTLVGGAQVTHPAETIWSEICFVQPIGQAARYLSDLAPSGYQHSPYLELTRPLGTDRNVLGGQLRSLRGVHLKGLGMPTTSRVVYELTAEDRRFAAELALDTAAGQQGSAIFRVFLERPDGDATAWHAAYTSPVVRGGEPPRSISLEVAAAQRIALIVDFADHGDAADYANWLDARLAP